MFVWKILKVCAVQIHLWHFCWHRACYPPSVLDFPAWTPASFIQKQCWHTSPQDPRIHGKTVGMPWVKRSRLLVNVRTYEHWCLGPFTSWQLHHHWEPVLTSSHMFTSKSSGMGWNGAPCGEFPWVSWVPGAIAPSSPAWQDLMHRLAPCSHTSEPCVPNRL